MVVTAREASLSQRCKQRHLSSFTRLMFAIAAVVVGGVAAAAGLLLWPVDVPRDIMTLITIEPFE